MSNKHLNPQGFLQKNVTSNTCDGTSIPFHIHNSFWREAVESLSFFSRTCPGKAFLVTL